MAHINRNRVRPRYEPSEDLKAHIVDYDEGLTLEELFLRGRKDDGKKLQHMLDVARLKVLGAFMLPQPVRFSPSGRRQTMSELYIVVPGANFQTLLMRVKLLMKGARSFVRETDLPGSYRGLDEHWVDTVCEIAQVLLVTEVLESLQENGDIWYQVEDDEHDGHWQLRRSAADQMNKLRQRVSSRPRRRKRRSKSDRRPVHGLPESVRNTPTVPASVGGLQR